GVPHVLVSPMAATLSAVGMLAADVQLDYVHTVMLSGDTPFQIVDEHTRELVCQAEEDVMREGISPEQAIITRTIDVRYVGQSFELNVPLALQFRQTFEDLHEKRYGYCQQDAPIEIVNVRVRAIGHVTPPPIPTAPLGSADPTAARWEERPVVLGQGIQLVPHYWGNRLCPGHEISGPAILVLEDTTVYLGPTDQAHVDAYANILIQVGPTDG
ncbi:MAG: hydantoinase/oxoprolinase family protein, partial [Nitrospirota bacterium]|nr:hydantoinase/oxoprolinase family protein [Nitrospirota bacterium]